MTRPTISTPGYYGVDDCDLDAFAAGLAREMTPASITSATAVEHGIPVYDMSTLDDRLYRTDERRSLMAEWAGVLNDGAGVLLLRQAWADEAAMDAATAVYETIIARERQAGGGADHFAATGANDRVWNALQKLCESAPDTCLRYFANPALAAIAEAWLGPGYQVTAQINLVHPGGQGQAPHRDYHLGFQSAEDCARWPAHVQRLSPLLTLQGAVAHCDMPIASGTTRLLPGSQRYAQGYLAYRQSDFVEWFDAHSVQLPLTKGDAVFFNPALFHAAGSNTTTDVRRMANLLQVSSAFGRAMESVDRTAMVRRLYPHVLKACARGDLDDLRLKALVAATAEGYSFPTNLDTDPPLDGLVPETQQALLLRAVSETLPASDFERMLDVQHARRRA